jgi:hypothetical protein
MPHSLQFVANRFRLQIAKRTVHSIAATQLSNQATKQLSKPTNKGMNMNTTKIIAAAATVAVNVVLAVAIIGLFGDNNSANDNVQVAKVESITIVAKRA